MSAKERDQRYRDKLKADPERWEECKRKQRERDRKRYARIKADPELYAEYLRKKIEHQRLYRAADVEAYNKRAREWQAANSEAKSKANKERRLANLDEYRERGRKEYAANSTYYKQNARKARVRKRNAPGHHTEAEWQALCSYYMDQCLCCGDVPDKLTRDHIVPLIKGGSDDISNIQPLCLHCNFSKHTKTIDYRV